MASFAGQVETTGGAVSPIGSTLYGICTTAAATAAKIVTLENFDTLTIGVTIHVKFTYSNTAASPTLNVNGVEDDNNNANIPIYQYGTTAPGNTAATSWAANSMVSLTYDGTAWRINDVGANDALINSVTASLINTIYPVGSLYMAVNSTSPASMFGGTWEQIKDKFILSAGDTYAAGTTGGAATHNHTTAGHTLTVTEIPSHSHAMRNAVLYREPGYVSVEWRPSGGSQYIADIGGSTYMRYTDAVGGGGSHSHGNTGNTSTLPPYMAVYVWKRVA